MDILIKYPLGFLFTSFLFPTMYFVREKKAILRFYRMLSPKLFYAFNEKAIFCLYNINLPTESKSDCDEI